MPPKKISKDAVTKTRASPRKPQADEQNLRLLWAYFEHHRGATIHHKEVAAKLGMNPSSAKARFYGLKAYMESLENPDQTSSSAATPKKALPKKGKAKQVKKKGRAEPSDEPDSDSSVSFEMNDSEDEKKATKAAIGIESGDGAGLEVGKGDDTNKDIDEDDEEALEKEDEAYLLELFPDI